MIIIDYTKKDKQLSEISSKVHFLSTVLLDSTDELKDSNKPRHELARHLKGLDREITNKGGEFFKLFCEKGSFTDENKLFHKGEDVYKNTLEAFQYLFGKSIQEIIGMAELLKIAEKKGVDFMQVEVPYEPLKN